VGPQKKKENLKKNYCKRIEMAGKEEGRGKKEDFRRRI